MTLRRLLFLCMVLYSWGAFAKPVPASTVKTVARNFYMPIADQHDFGGFQLDLVQTITTSLYDETTQQFEEVPVYYVFNVLGTGHSGFVMVTADDAAIPILGYSTEGIFDPSIDAVNYVKWAENYKEQLRYIKEERLEATETIEQQWTQLMKGGSIGNGRNATVNPLLGAIKWGQTNGFNDQCPYDNSAGQRAVVGCVATAMAQIMKYWGHPAQGTGFHSYNHATYGTQSVNYGSATYNWSAMPNATASTESAKLSYHCGVAVDMIYSPSGSGAYSSDAKDAFKNYFDYKSSIDYLFRSNYTESSWIQVVKSDLDNNKPIYYAGSGSGGGHAFVCDGYDANNLFHFNWGWSGAYDGYFTINALNPSGVGTGGGTGGFNSNHRVIHNIEPNGNSGGGGTPSPDLILYSTITLTPSSPIQYGQAFSLDVDIANTSGVDFTGDIAAALLDGNNSLVSFIETKTGEAYTDGFAYSRTFSSSNMTNTPSPGSYKVVLYQKASGTANWKVIGDGNYTNAITLDIQTVNSGGLDLYATITPSANPIVLGTAFTVSTNFHNTSNNNFSGKFSVDLHDMQGNLVMTLDEKNLSLSAGNVYSNNIVFSNAGLSGVAPGTYQIAAWMQPTGGSWELVGNGSYSNPIQVDVAEPALSGDVYENNNSATNAFGLSANFIGNAATVSTPGSNIHIGGDYDYYQITLPPGHSYFISAQVLDSYNTSGNAYDNDVLFSYDVGNGYSDTYDNSSSGINLPNGGTITFQVASYYQGQTGTYEFRATINRGTVNVERIEAAENIQVYPIPANNYLTIDLDVLPETIQSMEVVNALGQSIYETTTVRSTQTITTNNWGDGMYWILFKTEDRIMRQSFMIAH